MLGKNQITVIKGFACFVSNHTVEVNGEHYSADHILITATGGRPGVPTIPVPDSASTPTVSSELPAQTGLPVGAGYIAVEIAGVMRKQTKGPHGAQHAPLRSCVDGSASSKPWSWSDRSANHRQVVNPLPSLVSVVTVSWSVNCHGADRGVRPPHRHHGAGRTGKPSPNMASQVKVCSRFTAVAFGGQHRQPADEAGLCRAGGGGGRPAASVLRWTRYCRFRRRHEVGCSQADFDNCVLSIRPVRKSLSPYVGV